MQVLSVVNWLNPGGIETPLLQVIPRLQSLGINLDMCCFGERGLLDSEFESLGCKIIRLRKRVNCYDTARDFYRLLHRSDYSIVHSNFGWTSGGIALGAHRAKIPIAVSIHSSEPLTLHRWKTKPFLRHARNVWLQWHMCLMQCYVDVFVGHSKTNLRNFRHRVLRPRGRYVVVRNGVDFSQPIVHRGTARQDLNIKDQRPVLLHVGSFRKEKNHQGLIQILSRVRQTYPDVLLVMVGDGPLRKTIEDEIKAARLTRNVRLEGIRHNVWSYFSAADVFIFPSISEGFGNALVEAQAACVPVVASDIEAHHEAVCAEQFSFLFPLPDYDAAARLVCEQLKAVDGRKSRRIQLSQSYVQENFSIGQFADSYVEIYSGILTNPGLSVGVRNVDFEQQRISAQSVERDDVVRLGRD